MDKLKLDERVENALNAFFNIPSTNDTQALVYKFEPHCLDVVEPPSFSERADRLSNVARQAFLFLPGTILLYLATLAVIFFYPSNGFSFGGAFWLIAAAFLCQAGAGTLLNSRNLRIPLSIVVFSVSVSVVFDFFPADMKSDLYFYYSMYFFPVVLVISNLLRDKDENC